MKQQHLLRAKQSPCFSRALSHPAHGIQALVARPVRRQLVRPCRYQEDKAGPADFNVEERRQRIETGLVFAPFTEVESTMRDVQRTVEEMPQASFARFNFANKVSRGANLWLLWLIVPA